MRGEVYDGRGQEEAAMMSLQQLADRLFFRAKASEALSGVCPVSMSVWSGLVSLMSQPTLLLAALVGVPASEF